MAKIAGWSKDKDIRFGHDLYVADGGKTVIEIDGVFKPPFTSKRPDYWMFSVWVDGKIRRNFNVDFRTKAQAVAHAQKWMRVHPDGITK